MKVSRVLRWRGVPDETEIFVVIDIFGSAESKKVPLLSVNSTFTVSMSSSSEIFRFPSSAWPVRRRPKRCFWS